MKITEVRIKLMDEPSERLKAFCSITFDDCFVIRDLKIIDGANGFFVAMPSRKLTSHCPVCRYKNPIRAAYCNQCGSKLPIQTPSRDDDGRAKLYADIAHPINSTAREMIQSEVLAAFEEEKVRAQTPGYVSRYDDYDLDFESDELPTPLPPRSLREPEIASFIVDGAEPVRPPHRDLQPEETVPSPQPDGGFGAGIF